MIDALVDIVGAAIGLNVQTKHGLAQLIQGRPHVHVGEGQWKPIAQDTDGAWSYFRINGQMQVDSADIGMPCAGISATVPLRYVALLKRSECDELPGLLVSIAGDIRATAGAVKAAIGAVRVAFPSIRPSIDEATAQELGSEVNVPLDRVLVTLDITAQIVGEDSCLTSCNYQRPVPCGTTTGPCADATYQLKDSGGTNIGAAGTIASGGSANITAPDGTVTVRNLNGTALGSPSVKSNGTANYTAPIPMKMGWGAGDADTLEWTVTDAEAGTYNSYTQDGGSGTITYSKNGGSYTALSGTITLAVGNTIKVRRTTTTNAGYSTWAP